MTANAMTPHEKLSQAATLLVQAVAELAVPDPVLQAPPAPAPTYDPLEMLDDVRVSELTGISRQTLRIWRLNGQGPQFSKLGGPVRYRRSIVDEWIKANTFQNTGAAAAKRAARV